MVWAFLQTRTLKRDNKMASLYYITIGIIMGGALAVVYFSYTGSELKWKK